MVSSEGICMVDEKIKAVKQWPEPKSVWDIQVFLRFANFYWQFIQGFSRIAASLPSILKTSRSTKSLTRPGKSKVRDGGDSRTRHDGSEIDRSEVDGGKGGDNKFGKKAQKLSKFKNLSKSKKTVRLDFFTPRAKLAFTKLRQAFV